MTCEPAYLSLLQSGELEKRASEAHAHLTDCILCANECHKNRLAGDVGVCITGENARVSSFHPHHGEEYPLRGWGGSGTIFFARCNLSCQYCQNFDISQVSSGKEVSAEELAAIMLALQECGCHNINFVSPSHVVAQILAGVLVAAREGLRLPLVYNTGGYDSMTALHLLDGVIDIYMPDMKYADATNAKHYSKVLDYPRYNQAAIKEMHRQVGDLKLDERGIARYGLLVRHLVLPNDIAGTEEIVHFLAKEISPDTFFNLMDQYRPSYHASSFPELNRPITNEEYTTAREKAIRAGLRRLNEC